MEKLYNNTVKPSTEGFFQRFIRRDPFVKEVLQNAPIEPPSEGTSVPIFSFFMNRWLLFYLLFSFQVCAYALGDWEKTESLLADLEQASFIDQETKRALPMRYNRFGTVGYLDLPSARMQKEGTVGLVGAYSSSADLYSASIQLFPRLEVRGQYTYLKKQVERALCGDGTATMAKKFASIKYALLQAEDGLPSLPEISLGWDAILGDPAGFSFYAVGTKSFLTSDLELSVGWGAGNLRGLFGAAQWSPLSKSLPEGTSLCFQVEYSRYKNPFLAGSSPKIPVNVGISCGFWNALTARIGTKNSTSGGKHLVGEAAFSYDLGGSCGFFPKTKDPPIYAASSREAPLGAFASQPDFVKELRVAFAEQGFDLFYLAQKQGILWIRIVNSTYRQEPAVRKRVSAILSQILPETITSTRVIVESSGIPLQEYEISRAILDRYVGGKMGEYELSLLTSMQEVQALPTPYSARLLYARKKPVILYTIQPIFQTYFGGSFGKIEYAAGIQGSLDGYLFDSVYYAFSAKYIIKSTGSSEADLSSPSQIINVRSDTPLYQNSSSLHLDRAFLQKNWNVGGGVFAKMSLGYFEVAYLGLASELLLYPVGSPFALGVEAAALGKRAYNGLGIQRNIRKFEGCSPKYVPYYGLQYFLSFHYELPHHAVNFSCKLGQFLAKDRGARFQIEKTFPSGCQVGFWITYTSGVDWVDGKRYFDKGIAFSVPLDLFLNKSSKKRWGYSLPARLRDVGAIASTGEPLYQTIYDDRLGCLLPCY